MTEKPDMTHDSIAESFDLGMEIFSKLSKDAMLTKEVLDGIPLGCSAKLTIETPESVLTYQRKAKAEGHV